MPIPISNKNSQNRTKVLVVYPAIGMLTNPTVELLLEKLSSHNCQVDVVLPVDENAIVALRGKKNINPVFFPQFWFLLGSETLLQTWMHAIRDYIRFLGHFKQIKELLKWYLRLMQGYRFDVIIGADPGGLMCAQRIKRHFCSKVIYLSFEMIFKNECRNSTEYTAVCREEVASRKADLIVIQDEERRNVFCREKGISIERCIMIPVSNVKTANKKSWFLHDELKIPREKHIVLFAGTIANWTGKADFEEMVTSWSEQFVLVIHSRLGRSKGMEMYCKRLTDTGRIFFTNRALTVEEFAQMTASAYVGLAPYRVTKSSLYTGKNLEYIGLASGKVAFYAMCGIPVLASNLESFRREFNEYRCGLTFEKNCETGRLLDEIENEYELFCRGALSFYEKKLDPRPGMEVLMQYILRSAL